MAVAVDAEGKEKLEGRKWVSLAQPKPTCTHPHHLTPDPHNLFGGPDALAPMWFVPFKPALTHIHRTLLRVPWCSLANTSKSHFLRYVSRRGHNWPSVTSGHELWFRTARLSWRKLHFEGKKKKKKNRAGILVWSLGINSMIMDVTCWCINTL